MRRLLPGLFLVTLGASALAQETGTVRGRTVDSASAMARAGVTVRIDGTGIVATTAGTGQFVLARVPVGARVIRARGIGLAEATLPVVVRPGETTTVEIVMRSTVVSLDAVRIDAAAAEREAFAAKPNVGAMALTARVMQAVPRLGEADPMRVIAMTPGVQSRNDFSTGFNVRGGESDQNLILLDDYPIYNPFHLGGLFSTFIASATRDVQLHNGAFPSRYGGRLSSVIDVQSKEDPRPGIHGAAEVSVLASTLSAGGAIGSRGTWMLAGRRTYADQAARLVSDDRVPYYFRDEQAHVSYELPRGFRLSGTLYDGRDVLDGSFGEISDSTADAGEGRFYLTWGNLVAGATLAKGFYRDGDSTIITQRLSSSRFSTTLDAGAGARTLYNELHDLRVSGSVARYGRSHAPAAGYEISRYGIDYRRGSPHGTLDLYATRQEPTVAAAYAEDLWRIGTRAVLAGGVRADRMSETGSTTVSPRLSLKVFASDKSAFTAAVGRFTQGLHTLTYEDDPIRLFDYWRASDSAAPPSTSWQFVLGHERWLTPTRSLRIEGFYKRYRDLLEPNFADDSRVDGDEFLIYEGASYGADLFLRAFEAGPFSGWLAYTYAKSERRRDTIRYTPAQDRRHDLNIITSWRIRKFVAGARVALASGMPYTEQVGAQPRRYYDPVLRQWNTGGSRATLEYIGGPRNAARYPMTRRLDLLLERPFTRGRVSFAPYVSIVNATDAENVLFYTYRFSSSPAVRQTVTQFPFLPAAGVSIVY